MSLARSEAPASSERTLIGAGGKAKNAEADAGPALSQVLVFEKE
jgi:hypothetical protein